MVIIEENPANLNDMCFFLIMTTFSNFQLIKPNQHYIFDNQIL